MGVDYYNWFYWGIFLKSKGDFVFIFYMVEMIIEDCGWVGVVVLYGVLFCSLIEGKICKKLIEENLFDVVIGLLVNLFYGMFIEVVIFVFCKYKLDFLVFLIDVSWEYEVGLSKNCFMEEEIFKIVDICYIRRNVDWYVKVVDVDDILVNGCNLSILWYIDIVVEVDLVDLIKFFVEIEVIDGEFDLVWVIMWNWIDKLVEFDDE